MKELSEQKLEKVAEIVDGERVSMSIKSITPNKGRNKKLESIDKNLIKNALEAKVIRPNEVSPIKDEQAVAQRNVEKVVDMKIGLKVKFTFQSLGLYQLFRFDRLKKITTQFNIKGIRYVIEDGPFDYKLILCQQNVVEISAAVHEPIKSANP